MAIQMPPEKFSGGDPINILGFLTRFKDACNHNSIHEGVAVWLLQYFVNGTAPDNLQARLQTSTSMIVDSHEETDVLKTYPEVVNYLLKAYATDEEIATAYAEVISCKQETNKTETEFAEQGRTKARRCGLDFSERRLKSIFVDRLLPGIQATVRNHLGSARGLSYTQLTEYAQALGDSRRSVQGLPRGQFRRPVKSGARVPVAAVQMTEGRASQSSTSEVSAGLNQEVEEILQLEENLSQVSRISSPSTCSSVSNGRACWICASPEHFAGDCQLVALDVRRKTIEQRRRNLMKRFAARAGASSKGYLPAVNFEEARLGKRTPSNSVPPDEEKAKDGA